MANNWHPLTLALPHARLPALRAEPGGPPPDEPRSCTSRTRCSSSAPAADDGRASGGARSWRRSSRSIPLHVESVAWVAERKDVPQRLLLDPDDARLRRAYARRPSRGPLSRSSALALALGLMAKPMLVTLPFVAPPPRRLAAGRLRTEPTGPLVREKLPLFAPRRRRRASSRLLAQHDEPSASLEAAPAGGCAWRTRSSPTRPTSGSALAARPRGLLPHPAGVSGLEGGGRAPLLLAVADRAGRLAASGGRPGCSSAGSGILGTLVPVIGLVQVGGAGDGRPLHVPAVDRPLPGDRWGLAGPGFGPALAAALATAVRRWRSSPRRRPRGRRCATWHDSVTLYRHALAVTRDNYVAHIGLAKALASRKDWNGAAEQYRAALALRPGLRASGRGWPRLCTRRDVAFTSSTRRFWARPGPVSFDATGSWPQGAGLQAPGVDPRRLEVGLHGFGPLLRELQVVLGGAVESVCPSTVSFQSALALSRAAMRSSVGLDSPRITSESVSN